MSEVRIPDAFIHTVRKAFAEFGIDEDVQRHHVYNSDLVIAGGLEVWMDEDGYSIMHHGVDGHDADVATIHSTMIRTAALACVEWHLNNPRQGDLPL